MKTNWKPEDIIELRREIYSRPEFDFLYKNEHLGENIIYLALGGSHAYGTNVEGSDLDVRGICLERPNELIGLDNFEQVERKDPDAVIYALRKIVRLLMNCNPNCIELLATRAEETFLIRPEGQLLKDNIKLFLSQRAAHSFGGYATAQLRRLQNALARDHYPKEEKVKHMMKSIQNQLQHFKDKYTNFDEGNIKLWIDETTSEIMMDIDLKNYPLTDYKNIWSEMQNVVKDYNKLNYRNKKKDDEHLFKHGMHLVRLIIMGTEILKGEPVKTYRPERRFLLDIRNEKYTFDQIFEMVDELEKKFDYAKKNSPLPVKPNYHKINDLVMEINKKVII
jgi:predicted nucleotidyltransferase